MSPAVGKLTDAAFDLVFVKVLRILKAFAWYSSEVFDLILLFASFLKIVVHKRTYWQKAMT